MQPKTIKSKNNGCGTAPGDLVKSILTLNTQDDDKDLSMNNIGKLFIMNKSINIPVFHNDDTTAFNNFSDYDSFLYLTLYSFFLCFPKLQMLVS